MSIESYTLNTTIPMGNKIQKKIVSKNDFTFTESFLFEKELDDVLKSPYIVGKTYLSDLKNYLQEEIKAKLVIDNSNFMSRFVYKMFNNIKHVSLTSFIHNTVSGAMFGFGGLYVHDTFTNKKTIITNTIHTNSGYTKGFTDGVKQTIDANISFAKTGMNKGIVGAQSGNAVVSMNESLQMALIKSNNDSPKIPDTQIVTTPKGDMTHMLTNLACNGIKFGILANVISQVYNCHAIYDKNLTEMFRCMDIIDKKIKAIQ